MKRQLLPTLALSAGLLSAGYLLAQKSAGPAAAPAPEPLRLVRVATLATAAANREFQQNVQLLQAQRQAAVELSAAVEREKDARKKKELKTQLDALMVKLNENNEKMQKAYGFSLTRNYTVEIETAHVYLQVTPEEAAKLEQAAQQARKNQR